MGRAGRKSRPPGPERRCIVTRETLPKPLLVRFAIGPGGIVTPDIDERLPGRGIWVKADRAALEAAVRRRLFSRAAKAAVDTPDDLAAKVEAGLSRRISQLLSLARKSGQAVAGYEKVKAEINAGRAGLLLQASDGSPRQTARMRGGSAGLERSSCLTSNELGVAFGRQVVIHAALKSGRFADSVSREAQRLACLRETPRDSAGS